MKLSKKNQTADNVLLGWTMKSLDADKKASKTSEAAPAEAEKPVEKIDFSKVKVEPLFEEMVDFDTFSKSDFRAVKVRVCCSTEVKETVTVYS